MYSFRRRAAGISPDERIKSEDESQSHMHLDRVAAAFASSAGGGSVGFAGLKHTKRAY
jgi:hypothetical protein